MEHATAVVEASELVASVGKVRSLTETFSAEGQDKMFVLALENLVDQWEPVARAELSALSTH